jgi:DNA primase large subunit
MSNRNQVELGDFIETQNTHRNQQKTHYNEKVEEIINKNLVPLMKDIEQSRSLKEEEDLESTKMGQAAKHKSMVLMKEEKQLKNQVLKLARRNHRSLGTFIRLIDYMVVESQVRINQESADHILEEMSQHGAQNKKTQI